MPIAFDVETDKQGKVVCYGVHNDAVQGSYLPDDFDTSVLDQPVIGHNIKFDLHATNRSGVQFPCEDFIDTMVMAWLLNETWELGLKPLGKRFLRVDQPTYKELLAEHKGDIPMDVLMPYNAKDAWLTYQLYNVFRGELRREGLLKWFTTVERPLTRILYNMEKTGIALDQDMLRTVTADYWEKYVRLHSELIQYIENPNSDEQVADFLYRRLGLKVTKTTKSGMPSVEANVLKDLHHPMADLILEYRGVVKILSTYLTPFEGLEALHGEFRQTGTVTGRMSSANPNLQNIPHDNTIRQLFVARPGYTFIIADFSQMEYRMLAHLSGDKGMLDAFAKGLDIHQATADEVGLPSRAMGKTINFASIYGQGAKSLAYKMKIPLAQARAFLNAYWETKQAIKYWIQDVQRQAKKTGLVPMVTSPRKRHLTPEEWEHELYKVPNIIIQGSCADIVRERMVALEQELDGTGARLLLQVHDEVVIEAPSSGHSSRPVEDLKARVKECLEANKYRLPVEAKISDRWLKD